jgi:hypothetical protein
LSLSGKRRPRYVLNSYVSQSADLFHKIFSRSSIFSCEYSLNEAEDFPDAGSTDRSIPRCCRLPKPDASPNWLSNPVFSSCPRFWNRRSQEPIVSTIGLRLKASRAAIPLRRAKLQSRTRCVLFLIFSTDLSAPGKGRSCNNRSTLARVPRRRRCGAIVGERQRRRCPPDVTPLRAGDRSEVGLLLHDRP